MIHAGTYARECLALFMAKLGKPIDLRKKQSGRVKAEAWHKGSDWDELVVGSNKIPGGIAAWFPCFVLLLADCQMETRQGGGDRSEAPEVQAPPAAQRKAPTSGYAVRRDSSDEESDESEEEAPAADAAPPTLLELLIEIYGKSLANAMMVMVEGMDAYVVWRGIIREALLHPAEWEDAAFRAAVAAVALTSYFKDGSNDQARTWMFHIIIYILPLFIKLRGNLWPYSTAALEARGARLKRMGRLVICWRSKQAAGAVTKFQYAKARKIRKGKKRIAPEEGASRPTFQRGYHSSGVQQLLERVGVFESMLQQGKIRARGATRLRDTGRMTQARSSTKFRSVEDGDYELNLNCVQMLDLIVRGTVPRPYAADGSRNPQFSMAGVERPA